VIGVLVDGGEVSVEGFGAGFVWVGLDGEGFADRENFKKKGEIFS